MKRVLLYLLIVGLLVSTSAAAWGAAPPPRFRFKADQVLTYEISMSGGGSRPEEGGLALQGITNLKVRRVLPNGDAILEVSTHGEGGVSAGSESVMFDNDRTAGVVLTVKPDGTIASVRDSAGKRVSGMASWGDFTSGSGLVQTAVFSDGLLFGLQLPKALPAIGKTWKGTYTMEVPDLSGKELEELASLDMSRLPLKTVRVPVTFVYRGVKQYQERPCLAIASKPDLGMPNQAALPTFYFDAARSQLVGMEYHLKLPDGQWDITFRLVPPEKTGAKPTVTSGKPAADKPSAEPPPAEEDDFAPIVR